jgi:hypothetical protein
MRAGSACQGRRRRPLHNRLIRDQASRMQENIARLDRLREQQEALRNGGSFVRLTSFVLNFDRPLAERTYETYVLALPMSVEGVLFPAAGFVVSYCVMFVVATAFRRRGGLEAEA